MGFHFRDCKSFMGEMIINRILRIRRELWVLSVSTHAGVPPILKDMERHGAIWFYDKAFRLLGCLASFLKFSGSSLTDAYTFYCFQCTPCPNKLCAETPHPHVCYTFYITDFTTPILTLGRHFGLHFLGCIPKSRIHDLKKNEVLLYL